MVNVPIVVGLGGGVDSVEATLELLRDPIALRYLRAGAVMMAQTGHVLSPVQARCHGRPQSPSSTTVSNNCSASDDRALNDYGSSPAQAPARYARSVR
ncbi:hypothetical protein SAMN05421811_13214 [Nonomuraea wenchangensis]|uniref:Uncharacterized protein n=1 Tax=Nonomuraea wenchangensis TaxID=568860 RepID=A0A1I0LVJ1_9ACTN|nr:hypothetical protein SAMN05421811_13214 [Nonomuraea wenchangensis]